MSGNLGLLMATMEPPPAIEEEFQDWYDTEHFPERRDCEGFVTAGRYLCIDGWPKYLALYDLADTGVLQGPGYAKIAVGRYSAWTHRIMAKVWGQYRADAEQVYPGRATMGGQGAASRIAVLRFRSAPADAGAAVLAGLKAAFEGRAETAQVRLFRASQPDGTTDWIGIVELRAPLPVSAAALGEAARYLDQINTYVAYNRRSAGSFPATSGS